MKHWILALALVAMPGAAQAMTVEQFLGKVAALKKKGLFAIGSPDIGLLKSEMTTIATAYRGDLNAARTAGRTPHSCPPAKRTKGASMTAKNFLSDLEKIPPAERARTNMETAFYAMMKRRYPCPT